jgi:hypothetical protein
MRSTVTRQALWGFTLLHGCGQEGVAIEVRLYDAKRAPALLPTLPRWEERSKGLPSADKPEIRRRLLQTDYANR